MDRITPWITNTLGIDEIFVFGSNLAGRHGKGAAKTAMNFGAKYGQGIGPAGRTYAIPTMNSTISNKLSLDKIAFYVKVFIQYASQHPTKKFMVTEIGCGLAGWDVKDIAPMFKDAVTLKNVFLPKKFWRVLQHE